MRLSAAQQRAQDKLSLRLWGIDGPGKMRALASANQRKTGKIVPGFQLGMFLGRAHRAGRAARADRSNSTTKGPSSPYRSGTEQLRLQSCRRWLRASGPDAGLPAIAAPNGAPIKCPGDATPAGPAVWSPPRARCCCHVGAHVVPISGELPDRTCDLALSHCFYSSFYPSASTCGRWHACCVPSSRKPVTKQAQNRPNETILRKPRNHPETDGA